MTCQMMKNRAWSVFRLGKFTSYKDRDMLIFSRWVGQAVMVGDEITFKILEVKDNSVLLGFSAPRRIPVHRQEVFERIQANSPSGAASSSQPPSSTTGD